MVRIAVLDGGTLNPGDNPWSALEELGDVTIHERSSPGEIVARSEGRQVLVINKIRLDATTLAKLPELRLIAVTATGFDCVDVAAARQRGIDVCNVPIYGTDSVAQHVLSLLLHIIHRVDVHDTLIRCGEWNRCGDFSFWRSPLVELSGKTLGIVGWGRIGQRMGALGQALGMNVIAHTRTPRDELSERFAWVDRETLAERADVISLHCPLTDQTRQFVNREWLGRCRSHMILLNASRGALIDEQALADALNAGQIGAAGLDVLSVEPVRPDNPLLAARHCFLTPHMAWATREARQRLMMTTVDNVRSFLAGTPQHVVNR